jgi:large subunit ribosomal protein L4
MSQVEVKNKEGEVIGTRELPKAVAGVAVDRAVIHRAVVAEMANARQGTQSAKTRSEARGGGRKPYKQKKTGRARQGTIRAPQYAHGGMALAVKPRDYTKKVNKKERRAALTGALASKWEAGDVMVVDAISFAEVKTKHAVQLLSALGLDAVKRVLVVLAEYDADTLKCFRNLPNVEVRTAPSKDGKSQAFSTRDLLVAHKVVFTQEALTRVEEVWTS